MRLAKRVRLPRRVELEWKPKWEPEVRGWAYNYIAQNRWRVDGINDIEDLMQDAYVVFLKVADTYPRVIEPRHFMALYKTSLRNFLLDKARHFERCKNVVDINAVLDTAPNTEEYLITPDAFLGVTHNEGPLNAMLAKASPELAMLLQFLKDDCNLAALREAQRTEKYAPRMTLDQRLSKLLGIEAFPFRDTFKKLLSQ